MIQYNDAKKEFLLETQNTKYVFHIEYGKYLQHDFYGSKGADEKSYGKGQYRSFSPYPEDTYNPNDIWPGFSLNDDLLEFSFFDSGDFRCNSLKVRGKNGDCCTRFYYKGYKVLKEKPSTYGVPSARMYGSCETLAVQLEDEVTACELTLYYNVYPEFDVITRFFSLKNNSDSRVKLEKAMSICLDLEGHSYDLVSLHGQHNMERQYQKMPLFYGNTSIMSRRGATSHQLNPFVALADKTADEEKGNIYAFNFVYSGCFLDEAEVDQNGNTRIGIGLGEENFGYNLECGEEFCSPEAVMLFTENGFGDMSRKMHRFVRETLMPREKYDQRPVVLNTWEACYFDINEEKLLDFARKGYKYGMDMLVMDDGWFGKRNNDDAALGDWFENKDKFPDGLKAFAERVKATGIKFGIWIEPEMINPDSDLYRKHPDWCLVCKDRKPSLSRNQLVLDMCNPEAREYLKDSFKKTFSGVPIDYIKWDFNRHLSEAGSKYLSHEGQDEVWYRFCLGVYELYDWFVKEFPDAIIENCSGGGGRYDLAMMTYSPQIWCSDNTNAADRNKIQYATSFAYPSAEMSCHVSNPGNDQNTMRRLKYKFDVALGGVLGYELNVLEQSDEVMEEIKRQIEFYRSVEDIIKFGDLYRLISPFENECEIAAYYYADKAANNILLSFLQNKGDKNQNTYLLQISAADTEANYIDKSTGEIYNGKELRCGISVTADSLDEYSVVKHFEKM